MANGSLTSPIAFMFMWSCCWNVRCFRCPSWSNLIPFEVISVLSHFLGESEKLRSPIYSVFMWRWPISHIIRMCVLYMFIRLKVNHIRNLIHIMSLFGKLCEYYALLTCSVGFSIQIYRGNGCHVYYFVSFITYFVFTHSCQQQKCLHLTQTRIHAISSQVTFM